MKEVYSIKNVLGIFFIFILSSFLIASTNVKKKAKGERDSFSISEFKRGFKTPPDSVKPSVYWYWLSDNISEEGVKRDLEAMAKIGIGRAYIGNIGLDETPYGNVKLFSNEWWKVTEKALSTATKLGIKIGIFNSPGWSQSGGPWVKPDEAMRYLATSEFQVKGPQQLNEKLNVPYDNFQNVAVIAFPRPEDDNVEITNFNPEITSNIKIKDLKNMLDGDFNTVTIFPKSITPSSILNIDIKVGTPFTARSLLLYPAKIPFKADCEFQVYENGLYQIVKKFEMDRSNPELQVGFMPYAPVCISFPKVKSEKFRLVLTNWNGAGGFSEIEISEAPRVERYIEKQLAKMFQTPHPMWDAYKWHEQAESQNNAFYIDPAKEINITKYLSPDGTLNWNVPKGNWIILRTGMVPTGVTNAPAAPEGRGLEIDKMSKKDIKKHFNAFIGKILTRIPAKERKSFKFVVADSYETGSENWTNGFAEIFRKHYGYDPLPWLPVFTGRIVGSADQSNRFLWDVRRLVADLIAYDYVGGLRQVSHQHGLKIWLENYGHWGFPSEFLKYGGQSDEVSGEFWAEGTLGSIELKDASSAAHIYGKSKVWAESFTAAGEAFWRYPALLKKRGDWAFTQGINSTLLHVFISQPYENRYPGVNAGFGTEFNRFNTWFGLSKVFVDYMRRCNYMLQQGKPVEDVAYFIGDDAPVMTGVRDPELPAGYSFDYINSDVIEKSLTVKNGRLVLPDGVSYRMMVLPKLKTMRPELLRKIRDLIKEGAVVVGPPPKRSPSLQNYPVADQEVKRISSELWGNVDGEKVKYRKYGKGMVMMGVDMQTALNKINLVPDFQLASDDSVLFIHRKLLNSDIYFLTNQSDRIINIMPSFRVIGKRPELWDAVTGEIRNLPVFKQNGESTSVPITMAPSQSWFVVFDKSIEKSAADNDVSNFPKEQDILQINGPWEVSFDSKMRGPQNPVVFNKLEDWTKSPEKSIRYYSGTAVYRTKFNLNSIPNANHIYLNLGNVSAIAHIKVNGIDAGGVWTTPWQVDISKELKTGENQLEIEVANTWVNRLIGDLNLPKTERKTWTNIDPYKPDSPLESSGLMGPVKLTSVNYSK